MKRFGIFVIYAESGIIDRSVEYTIEKLSVVVDQLIIVSNGELSYKTIERIEKYGEVVIRDNQGFDAMAYNHVLEIYNKEIVDYDELIFCNDTFLGPFGGFSSIFECMEERTCDFWGLNYVDGNILEYLESYFLVFKKNVIISGVLKSFFQSYAHKSIITTIDVCAFFENGLYDYLKRKGFKPGYYVYTNNYNVYRNPDICLIDYKLPIIKRKAFSERYYSQDKLVRAINYAREEYGYDIFPSIVISTNLEKEVYIEEPINLSEIELLDFIKNNTNIYIYGAGLFARKLYAIYMNELKLLKGFIVSERNDNTPMKVYNIPVVEYGELSSGVAIINGLSYPNMKQVVNNIKKEDKFLNLWNID